MGVRFEVFSSIDEIDREIWNELASGASPMMEWEYFHALEKSGSASLDRGYRPSHLVGYSDGKAVGIAPLYERDRAWVEFGDGGLLEFLSEISGMPFYDGFAGMIPYTPVPGYQFLVHPSEDPIHVSSMFLNYIDYLCQIRQSSTSRVYFVSPGASHLHSLLSQQGYVCLSTDYFMWLNRGFETFEDYLRVFKSSRRTKIKRELREIRQQGIDIHMVSGMEASQSLYDHMYELYMGTWQKHMGHRVRPFLTRAFFRLLWENCRHRTSFSVASRGNELLALAIFYHKNSRLYGRYWGTFEDVPFLHFATCYYHPIEYAIGAGFREMDPGFGGEHKLIRGYDVVPVFHYIKFYGEQQRRMAEAVLRQIRLDDVSGCYKI